MIKFFKKTFIRRRSLTLEQFLRNVSIGKLHEIKDLPKFDIEKPFYAFITLSILLRERGEYSKALKLLENLDRRQLSENDRKLLLLNLIVTYKKAGFLDRAEKQANLAIQEFPTEGLFYKEISDIKQLCNNWEESLKFLEKANEFSEEFSEELNYLKLFIANRYIDSGNLDRALKILREIKSPLPNAFFYYTLSRIYFSIGEKEKAVSSAITGMKLLRGRSEAFVNLLLDYMQVEERLLENVLSSIGLDYHLLTALVDIYISKNDLENALRWVEKAVSIYPRDATLREMQFRIKRDLGMNEQVMEDMLEYLELAKEGVAKYRCCNCGYEVASFVWQCPKCRFWETMELSIE